MASILGGALLSEVAEDEALVWALELVKNKGWSLIELRCDAKNLVEQLSSSIFLKIWKTRILLWLLKGF